MLLERVLSKLTSFAAYSDAAKPNTTSSLEEDSDTSVFSDDEEYQEKPLLVQNASSVVSTASKTSKGKKRARVFEDDSNSPSDGEALVSESPTKRVKLELDTVAVPSAGGSGATKREVRFHPDTLDNWRWADRDVHTLRAHSRSPTPFARSPPPASPTSLPSITSSVIQTPLVATPNPSPLTSINLLTFLDSDRDISGHFGAVLPSSREDVSFKDAPEYDSTRATRDIGSRTPSLCGEIDPPSRSPSPDSRRQAWGGIQDGVWDDFDEEDGIQDMTLKGAPTPFSSPTLPSHPINSSAPSSSTTTNSTSAPSNQITSTISSSALTSSELTTILSQIRRLDHATQVLAEKLAQHRSQEAWRGGFQVGIHTQLTARALAAAAEEEGRAKLLGISTSKIDSAERTDTYTCADAGPSQCDLFSVDKKILQPSTKKKQKKGRRWTVIGKEEILMKQRCAAIDAVKFARVRSREHGIAPATVPKEKTLVARKPVFQAQLSDLEGDFEEEEYAVPGIARPTRRLPQ